MLTDEQIKAYESIQQLWNNGERIIILCGNAGTGKTYLLGHIIRNHKKLIGCCAPTNKAVDVLIDKTGNIPHADFCTIHSMLCMKKIYDDNGNVSFGISDINKAKKKMEQYSMIVVDETSMVTSEIKRLLEENYKGKILYVGDDKQLNPVNEDDSPVFVDNNIPIVRLTTIIRQKEGNPIIKLSLNMNMLFSKENNRNNIGEGYVFTRDREKIRKRLVKSSDDNMIYIAYTNEEVDRMNNEVRLIKYGENLNTVEIGDKLIVDESYRKIWTTNETIIVETIEKKNFKLNKIVPNVFWKHLEKFLNVDIYTYFINNKGLVISDESKKNMRIFFAIMRNVCLKNPKLWNHYWFVWELFLKFKYGYAITCHKAQGSTYDTVIINIADIMRNKNKKEREKLLYTAVTRSSNLLIIYF